MKTNIACHAKGNFDIRYHDAAIFSRLGVGSPAVDDNLGLATFLQRYAHGREDQQGPFARAPEFAAGNAEWVMEFRQGVMQSDGRLY